MGLYERVSIQEVARVDGRARRAYAAGTLRKVSSLKSVRNCGRARAAQVTIAVDSAGYAHVNGIQRCGSTWGCAQCMPVVRRAKAAEIDQALANHLEAGRAAWLLTLTVPHGRDMPLAASLDAVVGGYARMTAQRAYKRLLGQLGAIGTIAARDVTHGDTNGWHPHLHILVVLDGPAPGDVVMTSFRRRLHELWRRECLRIGWGEPTLAHGVDVRPVLTSADLARYLVKVEGSRWSPGDELARTHLKRGGASRSPWEIFETFQATGDAADLALWREYEQATFGRRSVTWSPALRAYFRLAETERADAELAADEGLLAVDEPVATYSCPAEVWNQRLAAFRSWEPTVDELVRSAEEHALGWLAELPPGLIYLGHHPPPRRRGSDRSAVTA